MTDMLQASTKGVPTELVGEPLDALIGRNIFHDSFLSPLVVARAGAITHNLHTMEEFCRLNQVAIAPHAKTAMASKLIERQLAGGAWGITVANAVQATGPVCHGRESGSPRQPARQRAGNRLGVRSLSSRPGPVLLRRFC